MKIKEWREFLGKNYWKDNQKLSLKTSNDSKEQKKNNQYYSQEIEIKEHILCEIDTFDCYKYSCKLGSIPYCQRSDWGNWLITVPTFEQLTDKDIHKAIGYVLKQISDWHLWNVYLNDKHIPILHFHNYERDGEILRGFNDEN